MRLIPHSFFLLALLPGLVFAQNRIGTGQVVELYKQHCATCHGPELEGGLGGTLTGKLDYVTDEAGMTRWIRAGNPDLGMPPFDEILTDPEIRSLVIYILEMRQTVARRDEPGISPEGTVFTAGDFQFQLETVTSEVSVPWSIAFLPHGGFLVTERGGQLREFRDGELHQPVKGTPEVRAKGQGGLMEVALHPEYGENGWIYLSYSTRNPGDASSTAVVRGRVKENRWVDNEVLFTVPEAHLRTTSHHFGSRFVFKNGYLYFPIGDRGAMETAQDLTSPNGKIHRIHDDGRIPEDNPFSNHPGALPTIWSYGHRNPQGLDMHPSTGRIWEAEHGPRGGDEINSIRRGTNYGWPEITYGMNYSGSPITDRTSAPGMEQPELYWTPSIAVCGIDFYEGDLFPAWKDNLFVGGLASEELHRLVIEDDRVVSDEIILEDQGRVRDVASGPEGAIYLLLNGPDRIVRILPAESRNAD